MESKNGLRVSLVVPVFNEAENIRPLYQEVRTALADAPACSGSWEILFVDDGSTDESPAILEDLRVGDPCVRVLRLGRNSGQSAAFQAGFQHVRGQSVVTLDGDLQNDPRDIPRLLEGLATHDLVCGIRQKRRDDWVRRACSRIANACRRAVTGDEIVDTGCSLKAFRRDIIARLPWFNGMHRFLATLAGYAGGRVLQVPVNHRERVRGHSKYGVWNRLWVGIADLVAVYWMRRRWLRYEVEEMR